MIDICQKYNITPNFITITRIVISLFVIYSLFFTCDIFIPIIGTIVFYIMDCLDGHLARSTNQVTILGDYLDHYADVFNFIFILIFILFKSYNNKIYICIGFGLLTYISLVHLGLQQKNYKIIANINKEINSDTNKDTTINAKQESNMDINSNEEINSDINTNGETNLTVKITKKILYEIDEMEDELLDNLNYLHNLPASSITWTQYFGTGTLYTVILFIIYYIQSTCT